MDTTQKKELLNFDLKVEASFSSEWEFFPQDKLSDSQKLKVFQEYFDIFPWDKLPKESCVGADLGCGSGRWATLIAPKVSKLICVDISQKAISVAQKNLQTFQNVEFIRGSVGNLPIEEESLDFAYSLGVLHHLPVPHQALKSIVRKLKKGAPLLIYIYYALDNRPKWYQKLWKLMDAFRVLISKMSPKMKYITSQTFAYLVYWPFSRAAWALDKLGILPAAWPLSYYRDKEFYIIRTDALDRFGTPLEKRFTKEQIVEMMTQAGLENVKFSDRAPYWVAVGTKR